MAKAKVKTPVLVQPSVAMLQFRDVINDIVRDERHADLTFRQFSVLLICYTEFEPHTVRGLAARLMINKPAVTRALNCLTRYELIKRRHDPLDRRSVLTVNTLAGRLFMAGLQEKLVWTGRTHLAPGADGPKPATMPISGYPNRKQTVTVADILAQSPVPLVTASDKDPKGIIANTVKAMRKRGMAKVHVTIDSTNRAVSSAEILPAKTAKKRTRSTSVVRHGE